MIAWLLAVMIHPIQFSLSETKFVSELPAKTQDFAFLMPGQMETYVYEEEEAYRLDYQRSYYAVTKKRGGWDCLRHYEIIANGCIPYFLDLENCPEETMPFLPKELILRAMKLDGVSWLQIDHERFKPDEYYALLEEIVRAAREKLTSKNMARYLLESMGYEGSGKILYLSDDVSPDYLRCTMLIGLKELLGERVVDVPKIEHIYRSYSGDVKKLYGKGFSYTRIVEDVPVNREQIERRILSREFDLIIYGSVHRGLRYYNLVRAIYPLDRVAYLCGEDAHRCRYVSYPNLFLRESDAR